MRVISLNANGLRSAASKGFFDWLKEQHADFVCIQETKAQKENLRSNPLYYPEGYFCVYSDAIKKGYSGVALFSKYPPLQVVSCFGYPQSKEEGRYLRFDYPRFSIISAYFPSGTTGEVRQAVKYEFLEHMAAHLIALKAEGREILIAGDYNIAHTKKDIENWRGNQKNSGFLPEERAWMDELFGAMGFVDAFRVFNQAEKEYTWWSQRGRAYEKNVGWRIDYQVVTSALSHQIEGASIYRENRFSDHAPLLIDYKGNWHD